MSAVMSMPGTGDVESGLGRALILALVVECFLLVAIALLMTRATASPPPASPIQIALVAPPAPKPPAPKPVVKPIPRPTPKKVVVPRPSPPKPQPQVVPPKPQPLPPSPVAAPTPPPPPTPPKPMTPPPPSAPDPAVKASYLQGVKAAIQAAVRYPASARMMDEEGRVKVAFVLRDGVADQVHVVVPGINSEFNSAALAAVRAAAIPMPPAALRTGKPMDLTVWVVFKLDRGY